VSKFGSASQSARSILDSLKMHFAIAENAGLTPESPAAAGWFHPFGHIYDE